MAKYVCSICGYVHEGEIVPEKCPICKASSSKFISNNGVVKEEVSQNENDDVEVMENNYQNISDSDREVYKIIQAEGIDKAAKWYKDHYFCSIDEAKEFVTLINDKYDPTKTIVDNDGDDDESEQSKKKTYLLIIGVLVGAVILGILLFNNSNQLEQKDEVLVTDSIENVDSVAMDIQSPEYVKAYIEELLNKAMKIPEERAVEKYFTEDFIKIYKEVEDFDKNNLEPGSLGFWDFDMWTGGQGDGELQGVKAIDVQNVDQSNKIVIVQFLMKYGKYDESKESKEFNLLLDGDTWLIDDFDNYKVRLRNYLENSTIKEIEVVDSIVADSVFSDN